MAHRGFVYPVSHRSTVVPNKDNISWLRNLLLRNDQALERFINHRLLRIGETNPSFRVGETFYETADTTFVKADFPELEAVIVECQGGGGAGGGAEVTLVGEWSGGGGGAGGGYSQSLILASALADSEIITVGAGGNGNAGAGGGNGGNSSFGALVIANGGSGSSAVLGAGSSGFTLIGNSGPPAGTGDLALPGNPGGGVLRVTGAQGLSGEGGHGLHGKGGGRSLGSGGDGETDGPFGTGGSGAANAGAQVSAAAGGNGRDGIVMVTLLF